MTQPCLIYVVSDSTGETAAKVVHAALKQFPQLQAEVRIEARVRDEERVRVLLEKAHAEGALVVFTLVDPEIRDRLGALMRQRNVSSVDIMRELIRQIASFVDVMPLNTPTAVLPLGDDYYRRVEAIEFAIKSDDCKEPGNLAKADLVIVGPSRTSKTPLSTYLAGRGLFVANVPITQGVSLPEELASLPKDRVVALTINSSRLIDIRKQRLVQLGMPDTAAYGLKEHIDNELSYVQEIYDAHPDWLVIDVTNRSIQETAAIILENRKLPVR